MVSSLRDKRFSPSRDIFEEAQTKIFSLMHRDSFPRSALRKYKTTGLLQVPDFKRLQRRFTSIWTDNPRVSVNRSRGAKVPASNGRRTEQ